MLKNTPLNPSTCQLLPDMSQPKGQKNLTKLHHSLSRQNTLPTQIKNLLHSRSTPKSNEARTVGVLGPQAVQSLERRVPAIAVRRLS